MARLFLPPAVVAVLACAAVFFIGGAGAFLTVLLLSILEIALSFDNAIVNAEILRRTNAFWRRRFLTWGIIIAVVGARLVLPLLLVAAAAWASPFLVAKLAFSDGAAYAALLSGAHFAINAFGASFLLLLALRYFFDSEKTVHWIRAIEKQLSRLGDVEALEVAIVLWVVLIVSGFIALPERAAVLIAGIAAVLLSVAIEAFVRYFSKMGGGTRSHGFFLFVYLNILDSAFSLDGVAGAFALTFSLPLIVVGLGIGAYFVRTLTVYLVEHRVLESLRYIEHGAYWAIFGLAFSMFVNLFLSVPEIVTGTAGAAFMLAAYVSSVRVGRADVVH